MVSYIIYDELGKILTAYQGDDLPVEAVDNINTFILNCDFDIQNIQNKLVENGALRDKTQAEIDAENLPDVTQGFYEERNSLLNLSDWTQLPDVPLTDAKKAEWATYRQALRDLPSTTTDFANPVWPSQPS